MIPPEGRSAPPRPATSTPPSHLDSHPPPAPPRPGRAVSRYLHTIPRAFLYYPGFFTPGGAAGSGAGLDAVRCGPMRTGRLNLSSWPGRSLTTFQFPQNEEGRKGKGGIVPRNCPRRDSHEIPSYRRALAGSKRNSCVAAVGPRSRRVVHCAAETSVA